MPKSDFRAVNRQFGAFLDAELKRHCISVEMFRKHCHFNRTTFSDIKKGMGQSSCPLGHYQQVLLAFREFVDDEEYKDVKRRWGEALSEFDML